MLFGSVSHPPLTMYGNHLYGNEAVCVALEAARSLLWCSSLVIWQYTVASRQLWVFGIRSSTKRHVCRGVKKHLWCQMKFHRTAQQRSDAGWLPLAARSLCIVPPTGHEKCICAAEKRAHLWVCAFVSVEKRQSWKGFGCLNTWEQIVWTSRQEASHNMRGCNKRTDWRVAVKTDTR